MAAADSLIDPKRITGPELREQVDHYWSGMQRTRKAALLERQLMDGELQGKLHENFKFAGADHLRAELPHIYTVPQRVRQKVIDARPSLSIPLGPKGLGITAQRLTTRVEQPLNAICDDERAGFQWEDAADILLFEGWVACITVTDPADWRKKPTPWPDGAPWPEDGLPGDWKPRYRVDSQGRNEGEDGFTKIDNTRAGQMHKTDLAIHRARNVPIRHRALSIQDCAPIFGDQRGVEGLLVEQEFSLSYLRRHYDFGDAGLASPTGRNARPDGGGLGESNQISDKSLKVIEGWFYDEDGIPYVTYSVCGKNGASMETRWKGGPNDGEIAIIDLRARFGLERLPVAWQWGLEFSNRDPDRRALPFTKPFRTGWLSVNSKITAINAHTMWRGYPGLIEEDPTFMGGGGTLEDDEPDAPDIAPMKITKVRGKVSEIATQGISPDVFKSIELEMGANTEEAPGKAAGQPGQSGFAMSLAEGFEKMALGTIHKHLGKLYEAHGSFVLEAAKRMPEVKGYPPIMVFKATDVPTGDKAGTAHNEPMELDPNLIDETFTAKAVYVNEMSVPERQQSAEMVERRLKTRRKHLEDDGDQSPETTELELLAEDARADPAYKAYLMKLVAQVQGAEELSDIAEGKQQGLMNPDGMPTGLAQGVQAPGPQLGQAPPGIPGQPVMGAPVDGSLTGMGGPTTGQAVLAGAVAGPTMTGPINAATAAGGALPASMPTPGI